MQKKVCPNGHVYDQSIYGDTCPLCPSSSAGPSTSVNNTMAAPSMESAPHTRGAQPMSNPAMPPVGSRLDPIGDTHVAAGVRQQAQAAAKTANTATQEGPRTVIRPAARSGMPQPKPGETGRKLVGFLVTYNRTPMGKAFNIYEGRNFVGRDADCDISIPDDNQMSGKHMLIRYLTGDGKFRFRDEMSSNGTYVNKQLIDEGELQNYDIIRVGSTLFIFIAIPQI